MAEPLITKLNRPEFKALAELQDRFIEMIYSFDTEFIMHGGTAIWRCYGGNRFSYDIAGYISSKKESRLLWENITGEIAKKGMLLKEIVHIGLAVFVTVSDGNVDMKVEIAPSKKKTAFVSLPYERVDGTMLSIRTLTPQSFILEKIHAYQSRHYLRDLYDIYQLFGRIEGDKGMEKCLKRFLKAIEPPLEGKGGIEGIILSGVIPSFNDMVDYMSGKLK